MVAPPRRFGFLARRSFTFEEGLASGATRSHLRAAGLGTPSRGIRVPLGRQQKLLDRVRPYALLSSSGCISHVTAAQLHGMPLPWFDDEIRTIHITRPAHSAQPRRRNVIGHTNTLAPEDVMYIDGVPVTTPERTFLDLSAILGLDDLVAVADFLICWHDRPFEPPKAPIVPAGKLRSYVAGHHRVRGLNAARAAMELMRVGVDSRPETRLRLLLHRAGLPEFMTNFAIPGDPEVWPDLACEEYKTSGQYEGEIHQTTQKQLYDRNRDERSAARGWLQVKVYSADMRKGEAHVAGMFAKALRKQGWQG
ncbi:hypothetical protein AAGW05_13610 [Arthrobacter sp. LAPM80]|uniref:hypothetical protein n=1 Tax=Arthrobacter sp. LAPM80 TaxID=3141788 RepID=UPI00398AD757